MSSGDSFGAGFDVLATHSRFVVPDVLGFGRSMDTERTSFGLDDHLAALDCVVDALGLMDGRWILGGHSMGGILALHWAARHPGHVERVVTWGAPLQTSREAALAAIDRMGFLERVFVLDNPLSRAVCAWSCRHRALAGLLTAATNPEMPVPLARASSLHTWPAYRGVLAEVILASDWQSALETLHAHDVPVWLARGAEDPVSNATLTAELADRYSTVESVTHPAAGHDVPLTDPSWCVTQLLAGEEKPVPPGREP
jgi:pimeloyl-ACP methyl ester carboxylesterase